MRTISQSKFLLKELARLSITFITLEGVSSFILHSFRFKALKYSLPNTSKVSFAEESSYSWLLHSEITILVTNVVVQHSVVLAKWNDRMQNIIFDRGDAAR